MLPTGEICKIGSCSTTPYWFSRAPLPDLAGLFVGWFGTTGVVTQLAIKLYPKPAHKDVMIFADFERLSDANGLKSYCLG